MPSIRYYLEREGILLQVDACYFPGEKSTPFYPGTPDEMEIVNIERIYTVDGKEQAIPWNGKFTKDEESEVINILYEALRAEQEDAIVEKGIYSATVF